jgi:hypothetical protein
MLLRLTDGTTTLTLSGAGAYLGATYFPSGQPGAARVTESFPLILEGTESAIRAAVQDVQQMFARAREREKALTARVFAEFRPVDSGDIFRCEIFDGDANYAQAPAERSLYSATSTVRVTVTWERAAGWEGPEEEMWLSSSTQTERTGGVSLAINDNVSVPNWAGIAAARVKGTRPAPIRLRVTNNSGTGIQWRNMFIGVNAFSAPTSADLWLLGSEANAGAAASWGAGVTHSSLQWLFPLSATLLGQAQGRTFRVIAAFDSVSSGAALRASVGAYVSSVYTPNRYGQERSNQGEVVDLGEFPIPPGGYNVANAAAALAITVRSTLSGSGTLDFVMLMPTDSYRRLRQIGYTLANLDSIEDDGIEGGAYWLSGSSRYPTVRASGAPLMVFPERDQRIYIMADENANWTAGRAILVRAWYRPVYDNV